MKKLFLLTLLLTLFIGALSAQNISVKKFYSDPTDLSARANPVKDENARNCALLKIITTETGFTFQPDAMGICKEVEYRTAEIWVWLAPGSRRLTIAHPQLGQLRNYEYPEAIESSTVYVMELTTAKITTTVEEQNKENWLALTLTPEDAAVKIDGKLEVIQNGQVQKMYAVGEHSYEVFTELYYPKMGKFKILPDETTTLHLALKPNFGFIEVTSEPENGASVYVNGKFVGTTPYTSDRLESKSYTVQIVKEMWQDATQQVTVHDNQMDTVHFMLLPNFAEPVFTCSDSLAEIWINGEKKGTGRWTGRLAAGAYKVEARKNYYHSTFRSVVLKNNDNQTITIDAPTSIYGKVNISTTPFGADILLDGTKVGTTPQLLNDVPIGPHKVTLRKQGFVSVARTVTVKEDETVEVTAELPTGGSVSLKSNPAGATMYVDDENMGTAPVTTTLSFGTHTVKAVKDGVERREVINVARDGQSEWTLSVVKPDLEKTNPSPFQSWHSFFTLSFDFAPQPQYAGTFRFGAAGKWGWNIAFTTNFNFKSFSAAFLTEGSYVFEDKKTARLGATAGVVWHPAKPILLVLNAGYGYRGVCYRPKDDVNYYNYKPHTFNGLEASFGLIVNAGGFLVSADVATINFKYLEVRVGLGGLFGNKR